jgi:plastocyanin
MIERGDDSGDALTLDDLTRRSVLRATGGAAALSLEATGVAGGERVEQVGTAGVKNFVDPVFGMAALGPNPCRDGDGDCLQAFPQQIRPAAEVDMHIGIPGVLFGVASAGGLSEETTAAVNAAVADGSLEGDSLPSGSVQVGGDEVSVAAITGALLDTVGFHYDPAGLRVEPGDLVLFNAETPDHGVAAYHEGHGRQNRVPDGVGPMTSPMIPVGGFWIAQFEEAGVYDLYCPPHQVFGMVMRVVVWDGSGDVPELSVENTGRPPGHENFLPEILAGLDPNLPSSAEALATDALAPENIAAEGTVSWDAVVDEHRTG